MSKVNWKKAAIRLARAIIRFQNDNFSLSHHQGTVNFAWKISGYKRKT